MAEEGGGRVAGGKGRGGGGLVCVYVCWRGWRGWGRRGKGGGGCHVCILRVAAVFACDYPL